MKKMDVIKKISPYALQAKQTEQNRWCAGNGTVNITMLVPVLHTRIW
jgi:hypothetical protein